MTYKTRNFPEFSACGLNCGLCPNYFKHTNGAFKCPGCAGAGFSDVHPACAVLTCCQKKGLEYCWHCGEYPCKRYDNADTGDSFITHKNQLRDIEKVKQIGINGYISEQNEKIAILQNLLANFNDGRKKSFFCVAVNLLQLGNLKNIMRQIENEINPNDPIKEKAKAAARLFQAVADEQGIELKLRK
ncbi:MAG: DUF3795 domain-containing protein [Defluviitaleaceae bacterium]|nr:DUF3795 domain-containing protein [Defluviitaleaceae bacterium]